jgi:hypothetical protein
MLYLAMMDITKKWTGRRQDWSIIHAQLAVYFEDRLPEKKNLHVQGFLDVQREICFVLATRA